MSSTLLLAITAGVLCGMIVATYFIVIDRNRATALTTNGAWKPPVAPTPFLKRF